jgi:hypothetical protein
MTTGLVIKRGNFGMTLTFTIKNADGTLRDLSGQTITLYVWTAEVTPTLSFSGACTSPLPTTGVCYYLVTSTDFSKTGVLNAEIELTSGTALLEDTDTFTINVIPDHP